MLKNLLNYNTTCLNYAFITDRKMGVLIHITNPITAQSVTLKKRKGDSSERETALRYLLSNNWPVVGWDKEAKKIILSGHPPAQL